MRHFCRNARASETPAKSTNRISEIQPQDWFFFFCLLSVSRLPLPHRLTPRRASAGPRFRAKRRARITRRARDAFYPRNRRHVVRTTVLRRIENVGAAGSALAATPASFAITNAKAKNPVVASVVDKRGSLSPSSKSSSAPMDATKNKAMEKLLNLKSQKEKQELLLDMPGMLRKLPDKGKSISERIDALTVEIEAMEKEVKAKYDEGSVEPVSQDSKTPVVVKPVSDPSQHGNLSVLPTPTTVMMSPSPSSPSPYASTAERESIRETVSPDIEFVAETNKTQSEDSDSFVSANEEDLDDTVEILDTTAEAEELDTTIGVEQVDDLANMMGGMGV